MDVEWAWRNGEFFIVQARPITALREPSPPLPDHDSTDGGYLMWNDSLAGDYLWTSTNIGEAVPDVVTPLGWSVIKIFLDGSLPIDEITGHKLTGIIGGRLYLNLSTIYGIVDAFFMGCKARVGTEQVFGTVPAGMSVPPLPRLPVANHPRGARQDDPDEAKDPSRPEGLRPGGAADAAPVR